MQRLSLFFLFFLLVAISNSSAEQPPPDAMVQLHGPCYAPKFFKDKMESHSFRLVATAESVNRDDKKATILFYRSANDFIVTLQHNNKMCVVLVGDHLSFGV